jgi:hypothetical protein
LIRHKADLCQVWVALDWHSLVDLLLCHSCDAINTVDAVGLGVFDSLSQFELLRALALACVINEIVVVRKLILDVLLCILVAGLHIHTLSAL